MSMYSIFGTKIQPKFTNDSKNILKVSSKKEIFFDVFECQLNGKDIVVEKTGQYENTPIVKFEIKDEGKVFNCEALLVIDKENDLYLNENNLEFSKNIKVPIVEKTIVEEVKKIAPTDTLREERVQNISDKIVAESEEKAKLIQEAKLKEYELKQERIIEQSENYLNGKFDNYIKENIHTLVTDSNLVYDKLVENLNNLNDGEIKDILGERIRSINEELNHQLKNEVTSMKKYVEMSSGGGTNAKQYANGGKMTGDLEVTGRITAGTIAGATELNGGTIEGNLAVTGNISADNITATTLLSTTQIDFVSETNGFNVNGDLTVTRGGATYTNAPKIKLVDSDGTNQIGEVLCSGGNLQLVARNNTGKGIISFIQDDGTTRTTALKVSSGGKVGIGLEPDNNVLEDFHVGGNARIDGDFFADVGSNTFAVKASTNNVGIGTSFPPSNFKLAVAGDSRFTGSAIFAADAPTGIKGLHKHYCYSDNGALRLFRTNLASNSIIMKYQAKTSNEFVITQNGTGTTRFKFETGKLIFNNDAEVGVNGSPRSLLIRDGRDSSHGLRFNHTGVGDEVQMGMYGAHSHVDHGRFKITHKNGSATNTTVLQVEKNGTSITITKPTKITQQLNLGSVPVFANNAAASSLSTGDVYRTSTGVLMIKS